MVYVRWVSLLQQAIWKMPADTIIEVRGNKGPPAVFEG